MNHEEIKNAEDKFQQLLREAMKVAADIAESADDREFDARYEMGNAYDKGSKKEVGSLAHEGRYFTEMKARYQMAQALLATLRH